MKTICLRFSDAFAPSEGTVFLHQRVIEKHGFVWFGKKGKRILPEKFETILKNGPTKIVLIKTGGSERYLATLEDYSYRPQKEIPAYYKDQEYSFETWLKLSKIELAPVDILQKCIIPVSGKTVESILKKTIGSYFYVELDI